MENSVFPDNPVLLVDDEEDALNATEFTLNAAGIDNIERCSDSRRVLDLLAKNSYELMLLDLTMPHVSGQEILTRATAIYPEMPVIVITGTNDINTAVHCMKEGAFDYMLKPVENSRLVSGVQRAIELRETHLDYERLKESFFSRKLENPQAFASIITASDSLQSIFRYVEAVGRTRKPVLITGETGTGKELIARAVHSVSNRSGKFIAVNVAGLDDTVFSDTLFGHLKGAFTGADSTRKGLIETAAGGTLFLDEIGDLSQSSQVKLLRLIQEHEYYPLGADVAKIADARIVVSTLTDLEKLQKEGKFRKDLFYRLKVHHIRIPPLRDRRQDIPVLTNHFLKKTASELEVDVPTAPPELYKLLSAYNFPGNVRELESLVFEAVSHHTSGVLSMAYFRSHIKENINIESESPDTSAPVEDLYASCQILPTIKQATDILVQEAVRRAGGNQSTAAMLLGISQPALSKRLKKISSVE